MMRTAIIGAGFAGLMAAKELCEMEEVTVFEEHDKVGFPEHCTGIVSHRVVEAIGNVAKRNVEGYLSEFRVGTRNGAGITIKGPKRFTTKLNRAQLEKDMLEEAVSKGAVFKNKLVTNVTYDGKVDDEKFDRVIVAEGWRADISRRLGIGHNARLVYGVNLEVEGKTAYPGSVEIWFDKDLAPGFFAWVVMLDEKAVVGTASEPRKANVKDLAFKVFEIAKRRGLVEGKVSKIYGGVILTGPPSLTPYKGKVCAMGDAAGLNKPLTGGGLYPTTLAVKKLKEKRSFPKAFHPLVERLYLETVLARIIHGAPQRVYQRVFEELDGTEISVTEYDNHLRTLKEVGGRTLVFTFMKALKALLLPSP